MSERKTACERCAASLAETSAFACAHGCTFCGDCTRSMHRVCPNCGGALREV